jgi:5'-3' exonuclease
VHIYTLKHKKLTDRKSCLGDPKKDLFCKIIIGDKSDNIPGVFSKCGIKTACKYYENPELLKERIRIDELKGKPRNCIYNFTQSEVN